MADREYTLVYRADTGNMQLGNAAVSASLAKVNGHLDQTIAKLGMLKGSSFGGIGRSASSATNHVNGLATALQKVNVSSAIASTNLGSMNAHLSVATGRFLALGATFAAMHELLKIIEGFGSAVQKAEEYVDKLAERNLKLRDSMRELANLEGKPSPSNKVTGEVVELSLLSGMTHEEATTFGKQYREAIFAVRGKKNIAPVRGTAEQLERDIEVETAQLAIAKGVEPGVAAKLATSIGLGGKITSKEQVGAQMALTVQNLNEGIGSLTQLGDQVLRSRATLMSQGFAQSLPDVAAIISAGSLNNPPGRTATRIEGVAREFAKFAQTGEARKLGITPQDRDFFGVLKKLEPTIKAAEAPGGIGAIAALNKLGFKESRSVFEIIKLTQESVLLQTQLERNRTTLGSDVGVAVADKVLTQDLSRFRREDKTGRFAAAAKSGGEYLAGMRGEELTKAERRAEGQLAAEGKIGTTQAEREEFVGDLLARPFGKNLFGVPDTHEAKIRLQALQNLKERGAAVGVDVQAEGGLNQTFQKFMPQILAAEGVPRGGVEGEEVTKRLDRLIRIGEAVINGPPGSAPVVGLPPNAVAVPARR